MNFFDPVSTWRRPREPAKSQGKPLYVNCWKGFLEINLIRGFWWFQRCIISEVTPRPGSTTHFNCTVRKALDHHRRDDVDHVAHGWGGAGQLIMAEPQDSVAIFGNFEHRQGPSCYVAKLVAIIILSFKFHDFTYYWRRSKLLPGLGSILDKVSEDTEDTVHSCILSVS